MKYNKKNIKINITNKKKFIIWNHGICIKFDIVIVEII